MLNKKNHGIQCGFLHPHKRDTMKKASYIFGLLRQLLNSKNFLIECRLTPESFSRNRVLNFPVIVLFILNLLKKSIPKEIDSFCDYCHIKEVSRSAVTQARSKISPFVFVNLNNLLVKECYTDNETKTFYGLTVLALDGSMLELPSSLSLLEKYGEATNQTESTIPMARTSHLFDVLNGITLDAIIAPYKANEREMAIQHFENIKSIGIDVKKILALFDRGYPSIVLMVYLLMYGIHFVMRSNNQFLKEINDVLSSKKRDVVIKIPLKKATRAAKAELQRLFPNLDLNESISIRVVVVTLNTGEKEVLITSLLDKKRYPYKIFKELYFKRWGIEEDYKFLKVEVEIENFSGISCHAVEQDFHASVLAANARALLALEATEEIIVERENSGKSETRKYTYSINKRVSMEKFKNKFVNMLLDVDQDIDEFCKKIKEQMKRHLCPIRPGRSFTRIRKHPNRKFHMNQR